MSKLLHSFAELEAALAEARRKAIAAAEHALGEAARAVQEDAQARIGEYQMSSWPFPEWQPLAASTEAEKARLGYPDNAPLLRDGSLRDSIVAEHDGMEAVVGSKDPVAAYQEFGTDTIPPRPFIGPAAFDSREKIQHTIGAAVAGALGNLPDK